MLPSADEDNDDVIESFWLYIFSVFPSLVYYYPPLKLINALFLTSCNFSESNPMSFWQLWLHSTTNNFLISVKPVPCSITL